MSRSLLVGGVPEHFNLPWSYFLPQQPSSPVTFREFRGGTGEMALALSKQEVDLALLLTEGAVKAAMQFGNIKLISTYVASPLVWGVNVSSANAKVNKLQDVKENEVEFLISRMGSGSHLMAFLLATKMKWNTKKLKFVEVKDITGAKAAIAGAATTKTTTRLFLWEKAMTSKDKEFKRIDELPTPWPCFVVAANTTALVTKTDTIAKALAMIRKCCAEFKNGGDASVNLIVEKFESVDREHAKEWLNNVEFNVSPAKLNMTMLKPVLDLLALVGGGDGGKKTTGDELKMIVAKL